MPAHRPSSLPVALALSALACFLMAGLAICQTPKGTGGALQVSAAKWQKPVRPKSVNIRVPKGSVKGSVFSDGFEGSFPGRWGLRNDDGSRDPNWGRSSYRRSAGSYSMYCAQSGVRNGASTHLYPASVNSTWVTYGPFSTAGVTQGRASFKIYVKTESGYDGVKAGWSLNGVDYEGLTWSGDSGGWISADVPLTSPSFARTYTGRSQVYFSFWFYSDATINYEGVYVDEFSLTTGALPAINSLVKTASGSVVPGVTLTLSGSSLYAYTGSDGKAALRPPAGTYTVTPKKPGVVFTPASRTVTLGSSSVNANFTATTAAGDGVVRYWGVCVGIEQYRYINNLSYCVDDAVDMRNALIACGWSSSNIALLKDSQATKAGIKAAIDAKVARADADDVFLYFHSSHGDQSTDMAPVDEIDGCDEYLCTYDTASSTSTEIRDDELGLWLSKLKTKKYVVMIDTCFSGGMIKSRSTFDFGPDISRGSSEGAVGTKDLDDNASGVVITACDQDEYSQEDDRLGNGVFAYYAIQGINWASADSNRNKWFSAEEIYAYAAPLAHTYNSDQTVTMYDGYSGSLHFAQIQTILKTTVPARNATGASRTANITVTFRYPVNKASAQSHFSLKSPAGLSLPGTYSWSLANRVMTFNPSVTLASNTQYTATVSSGLQPLSGPAYWYADSFKFTTATATAALAMQAAAVPTKGDLTQITVNLTSAANVSAVITNLAGRTVAVLPAQDLEAGLNTLLWNGRISTGAKAPSGQYLVRLQATDGDGNCASCLTSLRK